MPAAAGSRFPNMAASPDGSTVVISWLEPGTGSSFQLRTARWTPQQSWSDAGVVAAGRDWFVNWADFPSVVPLAATRWMAHWLRQQPGNVYSYDVMTSFSEDAGRTWSRPYAPHDDGTPTEHGFVSLTSVAGQPYAIWLDGRDTLGGQGHDGHGAAGAMTLRGAQLSPQGAVLGAQIDDRVCDCCQTDVAAVRDGLLVVYRDRSADEVRDIHAARYVGGTWSASIPVHADGWRIEACPVNGPAVAARGDDVAVAWFTAPDQSRVRLAFSNDGGRSFAQPLEVAAGRVVGRVDVVLLDAGRAVVSWLAETGGGAAIRAQPYTVHGPAGPAVDIATTAVARSSGFPQMLAVDDGLLFAWTESAATPTVRTAFAPLR
ncbi:MAG TPA: sialidase family protein [Steroidobacteraceae bacterium]